MSDTVLLNIKDRIAAVTLNRPQALNALNLEMAKSLSHACHKVMQDEEIRCVVLRGRHGRGSSPFPG